MSENDTQGDARTVPVQVMLGPQTLTQLEALQVALGIGFGALLARSLDYSMGFWQAEVRRRGLARALPEGFDFEAVGLPRSGAFNRASRRAGERYLAKQKARGLRDGRKGVMGS